MVDALLAKEGSPGPPSPTLTKRVNGAPLVLVRLNFGDQVWPEPREASWQSNMNVQPLGAGSCSHWALLVRYDTEPSLTLSRAVSTTLVAADGPALWMLSVTMVLPEPVP